jgi:hypothetical protein
MIPLLGTRPGVYHLDRAKITYTVRSKTGWQYQQVAGPRRRLKGLYNSPSHYQREQTSAARQRAKGESALLHVKHEMHRAWRARTLPSCVSPQAVRQLHITKINSGAEAKLMCESALVDVRRPASRR